MKNMLFKKLLLLAFVINLGLISSGCLTVTPIYYEEDKKKVQKKIQEFQKLYNEKKFQQMYELMSPETKKVVTEEQFVQRFEKLFSDSGKITKSNIIEEDIKPQASSRIVTSIYETEFEKGKIKEQFICSTNKNRTFIEVYDQLGEADVGTQK